MLELVLPALCIVAFWLWIRMDSTSKDAKEPPRHPGWWPIIGNVHQFVLPDIWLIVQNITKESLKAGGATCVSLGPWIKAYVITDPVDCLKISNACLEKSSYYDFIKPWLGVGLGVSKPPIWKRHRKVMAPTFNQAMADEYVGAFNRQARKLEKELGAEAGKNPFDFLTYIRNNSVETICLTALGVDFSDHTLLNMEYMDAVHQMLHILKTRFLNPVLQIDWIYSWTSLKKKQDKCVEILHRMTNKVLQLRRDEINGDVNSERLTDKKLGGQFLTAVDQLLEQNVGDSVFTDDEIRSELDTIIFAGHDTSANTMNYILIMLGSYPDVQQKVVQELKEVLGDSDKDIEKSDISRLVYLEAVMKETLRMFPIAPVVGRYLHKDVELENYTLYAGTECVLSLYGVNHHSVWGTDAQMFRPQRFLDPAFLVDHPTAFASFSFGKRNCIGKTHALMHMMVTLAHILRHYTVKADCTKMQLKLDVMLQPVSGHHISIERRTKPLCKHNTIVSS